jgi:hypothetical protein
MAAPIRYGNQPYLRRYHTGQELVQTTGNGRLSARCPRMGWVSALRPGVYPGCRKGLITGFSCSTGGNKPSGGKRMGGVAANSGIFGFGACVRGSECVWLGAIARPPPAGTDGHGLNSLCHAEPVARRLSRRALLCGLWQAVGVLACARCRCSEGDRACAWLLRVLHNHNPAHIPGIHRSR